MARETRGIFNRIPGAQVVVGSKSRTMGVSPRWITSEKNREEQDQAEEAYSPDFSSTKEARPAAKEAASVSPTSSSTLHMFSRLFLRWETLSHDSSPPPTLATFISGTRPRPPRSWRADASRHASSAHHRNPSRTEAARYADLALPNRFLPVNPRSCFSSPVKH